MADDKQTEEQIAQGMSEAGKQEKGKASGSAKTSGAGHGSDPAHIGHDMAESSEEKRTGSGERKARQ